MCFSATASFALSSALLPMGGWCFQKAWKGDRHFLPLAAFPMAFGVQQAIEGFVWLGLGTHDLALTCQAATGFVSFSHGFWLFWTPFMVSMLEVRPWVRWLWRAMACIGFAYGAYFLMPLAVHPDWLSVTIQNQTLNYSLQILIPHPALKLLGQVVYVVTILAPLLLISHPSVQGLGWLVLGSLLATTYVFPGGLVSVWCFFAAISSAYVGYLFGQNVESTLETLPVRDA
ncbi:DUF6629 family protein [Vacuolonema iberomarrocanum]|uniref:DUF6629 family protein n=1 Tax=Vacuolonema iberomarrocanum TaxID=3454632 RepID=UPI001A02CA4F|nr:hypothetical protein [filamentous cyanobacterium LEGE 07170]